MYIKRFGEDILAKKYLKTDKILIILGARQVGKTTLIKHVLIDQKAVFFNFDITVDKDRFLALSALSPKEIHLSLGLPDFIVIDEAQRLVETGRIVKGWHDAGLPVKIILLGSSSWQMLNKLAESLTGRNEKLFLSPLSFKEKIESASWFVPQLSWRETAKNFRDQMQAMLMPSLVYGNYPEVFTCADKEEILLNLANDYLWKDVLQMGMIKNAEMIKRLLMLLAYQIGSEVSVNELARNLRISRATVERYLDLLEAVFVIFRLPAFSTNLRKEVAKSKKIYFWDVGVRNAVLKEFSLQLLRADIGQLWENWIIAEKMKDNLLSGNKKDYFFWRSRAGSEVDLIEKEGSRLSAFEIKWTEGKIHQRAFVEKYQVPVRVINRSNFIEFI